MNHQDDIIYIATNDAMPDFIKVGKTKNLKERMQRLSNSSVPFPFECVYATKVKSMDKAEKALHSILSPCRVSKEREFFTITPDKVIPILKILEGSEEIGLEQINAETDKEGTKELKEYRANKREDPFNFSMIGIQPNTELKLKDCDNPEAVCRVIDYKKVKYKNEKVSLSKAARLALSEFKDITWNSVQGPKFWTYQGKTLLELREEAEAKEW